MKTRELGRTGQKVSEIGLGTWQLGPDWGGVDDKAAQDILMAAVDQGMIFLDTADVYGQGSSETRIGNFLQSSSRRQKVFIATKMGRFPRPGWPKNFSLYSFRTFIENSLQRLGIETIDLMQIHCIPFDFLKKNELWEWISILKKEGKVKYFGISVENVEEALYCLEKEEIVSLQIIFNIFRQKPIRTLFDQAKEKKMALIVRLPLASGLLSGKLTAQRKFSESDHRHYNRDGRAFNVGETFAGLPFEQGVKLAEELKQSVPDGMTMTQMAMRFILDFDCVTTVIPGATSIHQVKENASASDLSPLSSELHSQLGKFYEEKVAAHIRGAQ